jgi:hypothetical protein
MPINTKIKMLTHLFHSPRYRSNNFILIQKNKWFLGSIPSFFCIIYFIFIRLNLHMFYVRNNAFQINFVSF